MAAHPQPNVAMRKYCASSDDWKLQASADSSQRIRSAYDADLDDSVRALLARLDEEQNRLGPFAPSGYCTSKKGAAPLGFLCLASAIGTLGTLATIIAIAL